MSSPTMGAWTRRPQFSEGSDRCTDAQLLCCSFRIENHVCSGLLHFFVFWWLLSVSRLLLFTYYLQGEILHSTCFLLPFPHGCRKNGFHTHLKTKYFKFTHSFIQFSWVLKSFILGFNSQFVCVCVCVCVCVYVRTGVCLLDRCFITWATPPALFCVGYFWDGVLLTICLGWPQTIILLISASRVTRITGVSHQCLA
jgi:hypothetical protein